MHCQAHPSRGMRSNAEVSLHSISERKTLLTSTVASEKERLSQIDRAVTERAENVATLKRDVEQNETVLAEKEAERAQFLEENKGLEDERIELVEERASLNSTLTQKANQARSHRTLSTELERTIQAKRKELYDVEMEMGSIGIQPAEDGTVLDSVADIDRRIRRLERRLEEFGAVNMRAIEQYDAVEQRLAEMAGDFKKLKSERSTSSMLQNDSRSNVRSSSMYSKRSMRISRRSTSLLAMVAGRTLSRE